MPKPMITIEGITAVGWRAQAAPRGATEAPVPAGLSASIYVDAGGGVLWVGAADATPHARAIHVARPPAVPIVGDRVRVTMPAALRPWRPQDAPATVEAAAALRRGATRLAARAATLDTPRGFGAWLLQVPLAFPLDAARARADALAHACAADDPARAADAARALLGLGPGLTPAGDDLVGGAFFARALLARAGACDAARRRARLTAPDVQRQSLRHRGRARRAPGRIFNRAGGRVMTTSAERMVNVGETERIVSAVAGGALTVWGLSRMSLGGLLVAAAGAALGYRAITGHCDVYEKLGIDAGGAHRNVGNLGVKIDESIVVNAPPQRVYDVWRNLENLPRLLSHVELVEVVDGKRSRWTVKGPAGAP